MVEIDSEINAIKDRNLEAMTTPCSVFMTFENEEGVNRCLHSAEAIEYDKDLKHLKKWLDKFEIEIQPASEPTDIIWENRHFSRLQRLRKEIEASIAMFLMLAVSFSLIFICSQYSTKLLLRYPAVNCAQITAMVDSDLQEQAILEWRTNASLKEKGIDVSYSGYVQCFCDEQSAKGALSTATYGSQDIPVCQDYIRYKTTSLMASTAVTVIIVVINLIIKTTTIALIQRIGYDTHSEQVTKIVNAVFIG